MAARKLPLLLLLCMNAIAFKPRLFRMTPQPAKADNAPTKVEIR